jgi:hypothetical protein
LPTLLRLYRLACRSGRAAETCKPGNHRIRRRHRKTRNWSRRGTCSRVMGLAALCTAYISSIRAQECAKRKISAGTDAPYNPSKSLLLRRNWLRSARPCATRLNLCASVTPLARNQTVPPKTRILKQNREVRFFRFTPGALLPRRPTGIRVDLCPMSSAIRAQECTNPNWLPFAKTQSASADCASGA